MCGLFGFFGRQPDLALMQTLLTLAQRRGPDMVGLVSGLPGRSLICQRWKMDTQHLSMIPWRPQASLLLGHARLVTSGNGALLEAHPLQVHATPQLYFTHNGTVYKEEALRTQAQLLCTTACDSEVLGQLWVAEDCNSLATMQRLAQHQGPTPHAWVAASATQVWLTAWGHPLYVAQRSEGRYWCSLRFSGSRRLAMQTCEVWSRDNARES